MKIPEKGLDEKSLFERLDSFREGDLELRSGKMFGHAFMVDDKITAVTERAYIMYLWENFLDPTLFPSLLQIENEVVAMAAAHLGGDREVVGNFTSGGTESILLAVKAARDKARAERPEIVEPEMVLPVTAHAAFHKAAQYFCLKTVPVPVDKSDYKADVAAVKEAISKNTVLIVGSAPSYAHGVVDPVPEIGELAKKHSVPFHVDGCIGAFILPYFKRLGADVTDFDFSVPGVTSISMDFHKYAFAAKGASVVLYRNKELRKHQIFACSDWTGYTLLNPAVQSSRSGGPLAAAWAVLNYLGEEGYLEVANKLKSATERIIRGIESIPDLYVMGRPEMCLLGVASDTVGIFHVVDEMKLRGWHVQAQLGLGAEYKENFHLTVLPGNVDMVDALINDLKECVDAAKKAEPSGLAEQLAAALSGDDPIEINDESMEGMFKAVGIEGDKVPERMAEINQILNALPPEIADRLLSAFYNEVNRYREE
jgi:glutamate/tyrosine decarboxylase-like PLP-dependent enzyme